MNVNYFVFNFNINNNNKVMSVLMYECVIHCVSLSNYYYNPVHPFYFSNNGYNFIVILCFYVNIQHISKQNISLKSFLLFFSYSIRVHNALFSFMRNKLCSHMRLLCNDWKRETKGRK